LLLFTPGPTPVPEKVRQAMAKETIHHRTPEFEKQFEKARNLLKKVFNMPEVLMISSSGTGSMEATILNLTESKILTINAGKFGERFGKIAKSLDINYTELKYSWDTPASVDEVISTIKNDSKIDAIAIQISESSGGLRHPVEEIAQKVKEINPNISIIADGITAVGTEKIDTANIDALIGGSQKAFMLPPGLSYIGLSEKAISKIKNNKIRGFYFDLKSELKKQSQNTTAYTPATTLVQGTIAILEEFEAFGLENLYSQTVKRAEATRESLKKLGFNIFPKTPANSMTTVFHEKASEIRKHLKQYFDVHLAGGQEEFKNTLFRINHMGLIDDYAMAWVLNSIELTLDKLEIRKFDGTANLIFNKIYFDLEK
jgi:aspartate aminotransferase-like enzyme